MEGHAALIARLRREIYDDHEGGPGLRFTQDTPILPDIWEAFAERPGSQADLILSPFKGENAGAIARDLRRALDLFEDERFRSYGPRQKADERPARRARPRIAHIPGLIVASVYFDHLVTLILPSTRWWSVRMAQLSEAVAALTPGVPPEPSTMWNPDDAALMDHVITWMSDAWHPVTAPSERRARYRAAPDMSGQKVKQPPYDFLKLIRIVGILEIGRQSDGLPETFEPDAIVEAFNALFAHAPAQLTTANTVWGASRNRPAKPAVMRSAKAMKADAARRVFNLTGNTQKWAVIDSGIDGHHPAFSDWRGRNFSELSQNEIPRPAARTQRDNRPSRVLRTYDFDGLRELLDVDVLQKLLRNVRALSRAKDGMAMAMAALERAEEQFGEAIEGLRATRADQDAGLVEIDRAESALRDARGARAEAIGVQRLLNAAQLRADQRRVPPPADAEGLDAGFEIGVVEALLTRLTEGLEIDWGAIEVLIEDVAPPEPLTNHGTNVAAVLGGNWIGGYTGDYGETAPGRYPPLAPGDGYERLVGVCPEIELLDFRVVTETDTGRVAPHDFEVIAAMKLIDYLNRRSENISVHGANLSLAIEHNVRSFACGRTPICEECERLVSSGVVVVVAAGNSGYSEAGEFTDRFYRHASIGDPGNAEAVITVGATHRSKPHEYGVSFFSSRGPTGDGRAKPDLVAPGEKIRTATPRGMVSVVDGTSFSAPHVAGAAALMMERHSELIGKPERIKALLCSTATDLGRERHFQGAGMLDVLRALQSL